MLVDSHCHLDFADFENNLDDIVKQAILNNLLCMQTISTKLSTMDKIFNIIEKYDMVYGSVGVHPHEVEKEGIASKDKLINLAKHPKIIGIGETGLDYFYNYSDKNKQIESFINHIHAARDLDLPIIIHTRDADEDTIDILEQEMKYKNFKGLIHCFTSSQKLAEKCIEMGLFISISGIITFKNAESLREVVKKIPLSRLLIETDSPYLAPVPNRGKVNQPSYVLYTAKYLADLLDIDYVEFCKITTENFFTLFSKAKLNPPPPTL